MLVEIKVKAEMSETPNRQCYHAKLEITYSIEII